MASIGRQLAKLRAEIAEEEQRLSDLQIELVETRVAMAVFLAEYEREVWSRLVELQHMRQKISDLRAQRGLHRGVVEVYVPGLLPYLPTKEQWQDALRPFARDGLPGPLDPSPVGDDIGMRRLYRKLALQFHPDLAPNEAKRRRWTEVMCKINDAYAAHDAAALQGLAVALSDETPADQGLTDERALALRPSEDDIAQAESHLQALQLAVRSVEAEIFDIEWSWGMKLKKEVDTARKQDRDLVAEIAAGLRACLEETKRELASLQRR